MTGGAGFIGSHLVDRLIADGAEVVVLDNLTRGRLDNLAQHGASSRLEIVHGDIRDPHTVAQVLRGASLVYHLAAQSTVKGAIDDLDYTFTTNVAGTFNVLRAASESTISRLIFASSRQVYGETIDLPVDEGQPLQALNHYGASKITGEAYCRAFRRASGLHSVVLRLANVYGARDFGRVIPLWIERATTRQHLNVYGGRQMLDFVWVDVVVEALIRAAEATGPLPPINVGSGVGTPIVDLARRVLRLAGGHGRVDLLPARPFDVTRFVANVDRLRQLLGVQPPDDPLAHLPDLVGRGPEAAHASVVAKT